MPASAISARRIQASCEIWTKEVITTSSSAGLAVVHWP